MQSIRVTKTGSVQRQIKTWLLLAPAAGPATAAAEETVGRRWEEDERELSVEITLPRSAGGLGS